MNDAKSRAEMPAGTNSVLDRRTLVNSNTNLLHLVRRGDRVLDVGCGSGAITKDIAAQVGANGVVVGIDTSDHLIAQAHHNYDSITNLSFEVADLATYTTDRLFDVVTSARVVQWLAHPSSAIHCMTALVRTGGILTMLDYNHQKIEFSPPLPASMEKLYMQFLAWRADAGMDNEIGDHADAMFVEAGLSDVTSDDYSEISISHQRNFAEDVAIWKKVAETRGMQLVADEYLSEDERIQAIADYDIWMQHGAYMKLYLRAITGRKV